MTLNKWLILEQYSLGFNYLHIPTHQFSQGLKTHTGNKILSLYTTSQIINIRSWNNLPKRFYSRQKQEILLDLCNLLMTSKPDSLHNANSNCWKHGLDHEAITSKIQSESCSVLCDSLRPHGLYIYIQSMEFSRPEYQSGQPFPSPGIFPTHGQNPGLPHCRQILYQLSHKGSPQKFKETQYSLHRHPKSNQTKFKNANKKYFRSLKRCILYYYSRTL